MKTGGAYEATEGYASRWQRYRNGVGCWDDAGFMWG